MTTSSSIRVNPHRQEERREEFRHMCQVSPFWSHGNIDQHAVNQNLGAGSGWLPDNVIGWLWPQLFCSQIPAIHPDFNSRITQRRIIIFVTLRLILNNIASANRNSTLSRQLFQEWFESHRDSWFAEQAVRPCLSWPPTRWQCHYHVLQWQNHG